jgi:hypothetical protein
MGTLRRGFLLSSASGATASQPLNAKIENTIAVNRPLPPGALPRFSGAKLKPPGPGLRKPVIARASMITISMAPVMISSFSEIEMPA